MIESSRGMRLAIDVARAARTDGEPPFGAVVLDSAGSRIAEASDTVASDADLTRHAEVNVVRKACAIAGPELRGMTLFTNVEPCPMCFTAAWLARIQRIVFGTTMDAVHEATQGGQRELRIPAEEVNRRSGEPLVLEGGVLADECLALFRP